MSDIKNKVITISGDPASGKSTVVKSLKQKYEEMGFNVHVISTGSLFREIIMKEYLKMYPDKKDAKLADIQSDETFAHKRDEIDELVDEEMKRKGIEINSKERPDDVWIIDSRLAWHNIPSSYAVRLTIVDERIAGERAFEDKKRGIEDRYETVEEAVQKTRERRLGEIERYKKRYGVDLSNPENYDLVADTAYANIDELASIIVEGEKAYREGRYYPQGWASPAYFVGTQHSRKTCSSYGDSGCTPEELAEKMKREGYNPVKGQITVVENYGQKYIKNGHHRAVAQLIMGKTLTPYKFSIDPEANKKLEVDQNSLENAYEWSDCIKYFGWTIGKQEQFKDFGIKNLTAYEGRIKGMIEEVLKKMKTTNGR